MKHAEAPRLTQARQLLQAGERQAAADLLQAARQDAASRLAAHNLIEEHDLPGAFRPMFGLDCRISPQDDIFHFFAGHPTSVNPLRDYLADGWRTLAELMLLLEAVGKPLLQMGSMLEFASGHGRFTRHLVKAVGAQCVTVSDVVADAVEFSCASFGVQGFVSSARPEDVQWPRQWELVFVLSLFSHLPRASWLRWLQQLWQAVEPGGVLVLTTHGQEAVQRAGVSLDAEGYFFASSSESQAIDAQEYGTAFTSEAFVQAQIKQLEPPAHVHFSPTWFWNHQDAWTLVKA